MKVFPTLLLDVYTDVSYSVRTGQITTRFTSHPKKREYDLRTQFDSQRLSFRLAHFSTAQLVFIRPPSPCDLLRFVSSAIRTLEDPSSMSADMPIARPSAQTPALSHPVQLSP